MSLLNDKIRKELYEDIEKNLLIKKKVIPPSTKDQAKGELEYGSQNVPPLEVGNYTIEVHQTIKEQGINYQSETSQIKFRIDGARFELLPQDIRNVYPPKGGFGIYDDSLPHLTLERSTIPWERSATIGGKAYARDKVPYLALLVFRGEEIPTIQTLSPAQAGYTIDETSEKAPNKIKVITIDKATLEVFKTSAADLNYLSHVATTKKEGNTLDEQAVLIANRLPEAGQKHAVHLVSLEKGYQEQMVSLYSWEFTCDTASKSFLRLQDVKISSLSLQGTETNAYLQKGYVPLQHHIRDGSKTLSWFHGPMVPPFKNGEMQVIDRPKPQHPSDFLQLDKKSKMLDVSYAAAWQLGRLLTLQEKKLALALFMHKRQNIQYEIATSSLLQTSVHQQDEIGGTGMSKPSTPAPIQAWLERLSLLEVVPTNYLLPHPSLLAEEQIQFFRLDMNWVYHLIQGALTVGEAWEPPLALMQGAGATSIPTKDRNKDFPMATGFLLRSQAVSDFPDLHIDAFNTAEKAMEKMVERRLDDKTLCCIFKSNKAIKKVNLYLQAKAMHFGFTKKNGVFTKDVKSVSGTKITTKADVKIDAVDTTTGKVNIKQLAKNIGAKKSADFALKMTESSPKMEFVWG